MFAAARGTLHAIFPPVFYIVHSIWTSFKWKWCTQHGLKLWFNLSWKPSNSTHLVCVCKHKKLFETAAETNLWDEKHFDWTVNMWCYVIDAVFCGNQFYPLAQWWVFLRNLSFLARKMCIHPRFPPAHFSKAFKTFSCDFQVLFCSEFVQRTLEVIGGHFSEYFLLSVINQLVCIFDSFIQQT